MREWYAIFEGGPNNEPERVEGDVSCPDFGEFAAAGKIGDRAVKAMLVLDPKRDVALAIYGPLLASVIEKVRARTKRFPTNRRRVKEKPCGGL